MHFRSGLMEELACCPNLKPSLSELLRVHDTTKYQTGTRFQNYEAGNPIRFCFYYLLSWRCLEHNAKHLPDELPTSSVW